MATPEEPANRRVAFAILEESKMTLDIDLESPDGRRRLGERIISSLFHNNWKPDFKEHHNPSREQNAGVHETLQAMLEVRNRTETTIEELLEDIAPDGTREDRIESEVAAQAKVQWLSSGT